MAAKPLTREEIANTEKKLDMPLDDIIKMSKSSSMKDKKQHRAPNKGQKVFNNVARDKAFRVRHYMDSRPFVRQGALAQRRPNYQRNQFPVTSTIARKAAVASFRNGPFNWNAMANSNRARVRAFPVQRRPTNVRAAALKPPQQQQQQQPPLPQVGGNAKQKPQTLDALFANMKEQRMKVTSEQNNNIQQRNRNGRRPMVPWARGRLGY